MASSYDAVLVDLYGTLCDGYGRPIEGAAELLHSIRAARWAIVTSCSRAFATRLLRSAELPVPEVLISAEDVVSGKPAPDCYLRAAERLQIEPKNALVIEDSLSGAAAARNAGMDVFIVRSRRGAQLPERVWTVDSLAVLSLTVNEKGAVVVTAPLG